MDEVYELYEKKEEDSDAKIAHQRIDFDYLHDQINKIEKFIKKLLEELKDFGIELQY